MSYLNIILRAAKFVKVPGALLVAVCMQETGLTNVVHKYDGGSPSIGICQLKTETAAMVGFKGKAKDLMNPTTNALYAAKYLKYQLNRYEGNMCMATAAYNSGTYQESQKSPGYPKNLKYVRGVQRKIASKYKGMLTCNEEVAEK